MGLVPGSHRSGLDPRICIPADLRRIRRRREARPNQTGRYRHTLLPVLRTTANRVASRLSHPKLVLGQSRNGLRLQRFHLARGNRQPFGQPPARRSTCYFDHRDNKGATCLRAEGSKRKGSDSPISVGAFSILSEPCWKSPELAIVKLDPDSEKLSGTLLRPETVARISEAQRVVLEKLATAWEQGEFNYQNIHNASPESPSTMGRFGEQAVLSVPMASHGRSSGI